MFGRNLIGTAGLSVIALSLAGCGVGTNTVFSVDAGTANQALADGKTLHSNTSNNTSVGLSADKTAHTTPDVTFAENDQGGVDVNIGGEVLSFTAADLEAGENWHTWETDDTRVNVAQWSEYGKFVWYDTWDENGVNVLDGVAVIGTETTADVIASKANATYSGFSEIWVNDEGLLSDLEMAADFNAGTISGSLTNFVLSNDTSISVPGTVNMESANIVGNGFAGDILSTGAGLAGQEFTGIYNGKFYGPNGEEVAGVLAGSNVDNIGYGAFHGTENTD